MAVDAVAFVHAPEWRTLPPDEKVRRYFAAVGLPANCNAERIKQTLAREHSSLWRQVGDVAARRAAGDFSDDFYALKNSSLRFSLLLGASERGDMHQAFLGLLDQYSPSASTILDIGCENGFLTCFYALKWPNAKVVGLDPSDAAITRAKELADRLRLTNVEFQSGFAREIPTKLTARTFDLILSVTVLHDGNIFPASERLITMPATCFAPSAVTESTVEIAAIAKTLAGSKAQWIAAEWCARPATFWWWCRALDQVGLGVDWPNSARTVIAAEKTPLTILVASPGAQRPLNADLAQGFWISRDFNHWGDKVAWAVHGPLAETLFAQLGPKTCVASVVARDPDGSELHRVEMWTCGPLSLYYATGRVGHTDLQFRALTDLTAMRGHWRQTTQSMRSRAPASVRFEETGNL